MHVLAQRGWRVDALGGTRVPSANGTAASRRRAVVGRRRRGTRSDPASSAGRDSSEMTVRVRALRGHVGITGWGSHLSSDLVPTARYCDSAEALARDNSERRRQR